MLHTFNSFDLQAKQLLVQFELCLFVLRLCFVLRDGHFIFLFLVF